MCTLSSPLSAPENKEHMPPRFITLLAFESYTPRAALTFTRTKAYHLPNYPVTILDLHYHMLDFCILRLPVHARHNHALQSPATIVTLHVINEAATRRVRQRGT